MFFNSFDFAIFLPIVFFLYWFILNKNLQIQNLFIVFASYFFYGWWDWRFLGLLLFSTFTDYVVGILLSKQNNNRKRKFLLLISVIINLTILGFFKYYNFFIENFIIAFSFFGISFSPSQLKIILPIGISFYTFQTMSYSIDIYYRKLEATTNFITFAAFVSFFPGLVAGPIERAVNFLPQFKKAREFSYHNAVDGGKQMLWGLFKKVVIADNCAAYVNIVFDDFANCSGSTLFLAIILFTFQVYGDFSGYSDIAIGVAKLFGFKLMKNFAFPFFSRDIPELWRRWHISLTTWFRDYIYFPLGGNRKGLLITVVNTFIVFLISGLWHGPRWTYITLGFVTAVYFVPSIIFKKNKQKTAIVAENSALPNIGELLAIIKTFLLFAFPLIIFRSESMGNAFVYIKNLFSLSFFTLPAIDIAGRSTFAVILLTLPFFVIVEWINRREEYGFSRQFKQKKLRFVSYVIIALIIFLFAGEPESFIYFQF